MLPLWTGLTLLSAASAMPKMRNHSPYTCYLVELSDFNEFPKSTEPNRLSDDCFFKNTEQGFLQAGCTSKQNGYARSQEGIHADSHGDL